MTDTTYMKPAVELMHISHAMKINNTNISQSLEPSVIPYQTNQLTDL